VPFPTPHPPVLASRFTAFPTTPTLQLARVAANQNHEGHQGNTKYSREKPSCNLRVLRGFSFSFLTPLRLYGETPQGRISAAFSQRSPAHGFFLRCQTEIVSDSPEIEIELQSEWVTHNACYDAW